MTNSKKNNVALLLTLVFVATTMTPAAAGQRVPSPFAGALPECLLAVEDDVDGHSLTAQSDGDRGRQLSVVFDDEDAHLRFRSPKMRQQALAFSACMRQHGVPDFPDPTFSGSAGKIGFQGNGKSDLNPNSPTFQAAQQACQGFTPFKGRGASSSGGAK